MKVFEKFPKKETCPICGTNENKECILIAVNGTRKGNIVEAKIFHLDCINLIYYQNDNIIAQKWK